MIELLAMSVGLALLDSLNPATIGTMAVLLPLVKHPDHSLYFLFSTYITYFFGGVFLYFGIDQFLGQWIKSIVERYPNVISIVNLFLGVILIGSGLWLYIYKRKRKDSGENASQNFGLKSLKPHYLFMFGIVSTISDLPTALPLIGFVGKLIDFRPTLITLLLLLLLYVLIYVAPLIALYFVYKVVKEKIHNLAMWFNRAIVNFNQYALPPLLLALGMWIFYIGIIGT